MSNSMLPGVEKDPQYLLCKLALSLGRPHALIDIADSDLGEIALYVFYRVIKSWDTK